MSAGPTLALPQRANTVTAITRRPSRLEGMAGAGQDVVE